MLQNKITIIIFLICFICYESKKTLVLLDDWNNVETNSIFWSQISEMGYQIEFKMATDKEIKLPIMVNISMKILYFLLLHI